MSKLFSNLKISSIENLSTIPCENLICCVCLEVIFNPFECINCEIMICGICKNSLNLLGKNCIKDKCKNSIKRANKFIRQTLSLIILSCSYCNKKGINYDNYQEHLDNCKIYNINEDIKKIIELQNLDLQISNYSTSINNKEKIDIFSDVTNLLKPNEKLEIYNATIEGDIIKFKKVMLTYNFPFFEEISQIGFKWTAIHYSFHFGLFDIIKYICSHLNEKKLLNSALLLKSKDGRCPLLCLLKSNNIKIDEKTKILNYMMDNYNLKLDENILEEAKRRKINLV